MANGIRRLTANFTLQEFACSDGSPVPDKYIVNVEELARNLQIIRDAIGAPLHINSAYRTPSHNARVGGAADSQHLKAKAADITTKNMTPKQLYDLIERLTKAGTLRQGGRGLYKGFVHFDIRGERARWKG